MPDSPAALNIEVLWEKEHDLGSITKIAFNAEPGMDVPAYICIPKNVKPPYAWMICLQASIAPRLLLHTYSSDDRHSNQEGMVQCVWAADEVYKFLGCPENHAFHIRPGKHQHSPEDWNVLLDFIGKHWQGKETRAAYNTHQYGHLKPAFSWKARD